MSQKREREGVEERGIEKEREEGSRGKGRGIKVWPTQLSNCQFRANEP